MSKSKKILALTVTLSLLIAACGGSSSGEEAGSPSPRAVATAAPTDGMKSQTAMPMSFDLMYMAGMSEHHQSAIDMAEAALQHSEHPEVKTLARAIIESQQAEQVQMERYSQQ
ncbi:MAG: DUF305 domain-containing protein [Chloroflexia bacterium]